LLNFFSFKERNFESPFDHEDNVVKDERSLTKTLKNIENSISISPKLYFSGRDLYGRSKSSIF
jgi:hypothetical protein